MIEPFTIEETRTEPDGSVGLIYVVKVRTIDDQNTMVTRSVRGYFNVQNGEDAKLALFEHLKQAGWIQ